MTKPGLSTEHPKWLYAAGRRPALAQNEAHETELREKGFSHEQPVEEPSANWQNKPLTANAGQEVKGTVPTAVMDGAIESLKAKFDASWNAKCAELETAKDRQRGFEEQLSPVRGDYEKLTGEHAALVAEHAKLLAEQNALLAATQANKPAPIKPPVSVTKG